MALTFNTKSNIAFKKSQGKANTLLTKEYFEENILSTFDVSSEHVFGEAIPFPLSNPNQYQINGNVEYVRFELEFIQGASSPSYWTTNQPSDDCTPCPPNPSPIQLPPEFNGRHTFAIKLPSQYQNVSNNPNKSNSKYNNPYLYQSNFKLQLVSPKHGEQYKPSLYTGIGLSSTKIEDADGRDWVVDFAAGLVYQEQPPGPGDFTTNPTFLEGWLYIGNYLDETITSIVENHENDISDIYDIINNNAGTIDGENQFVVKKLIGKAHTSPYKLHYNEFNNSFVYANASHIFASAPPIIGNTEYQYYDIVDNKVEYVRLTAEYVDDSQTIEGRHAMVLKLPDDYITQSSNPMAALGFWENGQALNFTSGSVQMVPPYFNNNDINYEIKAYYLDNGNEVFITPEDEREWHIDYQAGIFYQNKPYTDPSKDPVYVDAWLWTGGMVSEGVGKGGSDAIGGMERYWLKVANTIPSGSLVQIQDFDLTGITYNLYNINVYVNGQYQLLGDEDQFVSGSYDVGLFNDNRFKFSWALEQNDIIQVLLQSTVDLSQKPLTIWEEDETLERARVITAGEGLYIDTATPREFVINNTGLLERTKYNILNDGELYHAGLTGMDIFQMQSELDFSKVNYDDNLHDLFIDGVLKIKNIHYQLADMDPTLHTNQFRLLGDEYIHEDSYVTVVLF